jgi:hypothetical protein
MNALMTGLGIGLAFWIVIIPALLTSIRRNSIGQTEANKKSLELLEERNQTDRELVAAIYHIVNEISSLRKPN